MENYVAGQLAALGAAVALGAAGGLIYDLLRVLRRRRPGLTHAADAVFGLVCLLGTLWALTRVGGGEPQLAPIAAERAAARAAQDAQHGRIRVHPDREARQKPRLPRKSRKCPCKYAHEQHIEARLGGNSQAF